MTFEQRVETAEKIANVNEREDKIAEIVLSSSEKESLDAVKSAVAKLSDANMRDTLEQWLYFSRAKESAVGKRFDEAEKFAARVADDVRTLLPELVGDLPAFMEKSKTFDLFRYDRCLEATPDNVARTREWVRFTTALTRYEAQGFLALADLTKVRGVMDLGGNSGEFALRLCRANPQLNAVVFDLPVVAAIAVIEVAQVATETVVTEVVPAATAAAVTEATPATVTATTGPAPATTTVTAATAAMPAPADRNIPTAAANTSFFASFISTLLLGPSDVSVTRTPRARDASNRQV